MSSPDDGRSPETPSSGWIGRILAYASTSKKRQRVETAVEDIEETAGTVPHSDRRKRQRRVSPLPRLDLSEKFPPQASSAAPGEHQSQEQRVVDFQGISSNTQQQKQPEQLRPAQGTAARNRKSVWKSPSMNGVALAPISPKKDLRRVPRVAGGGKTAVVPASAGTSGLLHNRAYVPRSAVLVGEPHWLVRSSNTRGPLNQGRLTQALENMAANEGALFPTSAIPASQVTFKTGPRILGERQRASRLPHIEERSTMQQQKQQQQNQPRSRSVRFEEDQVVMAATPTKPPAAPFSRKGTPFTFRQSVSLSPSSSSSKGPSKGSASPAVPHPIPPKHGLSLGPNMPAVFDLEDEEFSLRPAIPALIKVDGETLCEQVDTSGLKFDEKDDVQTSTTSTPTRQPKQPRTTPVLSTMDDSSDWKCVFCEAMNRNDESMCSKCERRRPANETTLAEGFFMFKDVNKGKWKCDGCGVYNMYDYIECLSCKTKRKDAPETSKPTCVIASSSIGPGGFTFGGSAPEKNAPANGASLASSGFRFGAPIVPTEKSSSEPKTKSMFSFGMKPTPENGNKLSSSTRPTGGSQSPSGQAEKPALFGSSKDSSSGVSSDAPTLFGSSGQANAALPKSEDITTPVAPSAGAASVTSANQSQKPADVGGLFHAPTPTVKEGQKPKSTELPAATKDPSKPSFGFGPQVSGSIATAGLAAEAPKPTLPFGTTSSPMFGARENGQSVTTTAIPPIFGSSQNAPSEDRERRKKRRNDEDKSGPSATNDATVTPASGGFAPPQGGFSFPTSAPKQPPNQESVTAGAPAQTSGETKFSQPDTPNPAIATGAAGAEVTADSTHASVTSQFGSVPAPAPAPTPQTGTSGFVFGSSSAAAAAPAAASDGAAAPSTAGKPMFAFGAPNAATPGHNKPPAKVQTSATPAFSFGMSASTPATASGSAPAPASTHGATGFSFGGSAPAPATAAGGVPTPGVPTATPGFGFGNTGPAAGTAAGSTPAPAAQTSTPAFGFGSTPGPSNAPSTQPQTSFSFGGNANTTTTPSFAQAPQNPFGSTPTTTPAAGGTTGFSFGVSAPAGAAPQSAQPAFGSAPSGGFFGAAAAPTPTPNTGFVPQTFGGTVAPAQTPGTFGGAGFGVAAPSGFPAPAATPAGFGTGFGSGAPPSAPGAMGIQTPQFSIGTGGTGASSTGRRRIVKAKRPSVQR